MSITLGNARRNASSTVSPLMPRLYTCGSNRSSSRRRGTLSQSCLMLFLVSVMHPLYLTENSETRTNYLENQRFSTLRLVPSLLSTLRAFKALAPQHVGFFWSGLALPRPRKRRSGKEGSMLVATLRDDLDEVLRAADVREAAG